MRDLHVVALSEDGQYVELASSADARRPTHRIAVDDRLRAALRGRLPRPGQSEAPPTALTPKEIQQRLRAGESPEQLAAAARMPLERIERYAGPVLSERERMIEQARAAVLVRARLGASTVPLGEAVDTQLAATSGIRPATVEWTARRRDDGSWEIAVDFVARARKRTAVWSYEPGTRTVTALDSTASALGHVEAAGAAPAPRRRKPAPAAPAVPAKERPAARTKAKPKRRSAPPPEPIAEASPPRKKPATKRAAAPPPAPPQKRTAPAPRPASETKSRGRAVVPAWADVLLGATPGAPKPGREPAPRGKRRRTG